MPMHEKFAPLLTVILLAIGVMTSPSAPSTPMEVSRAAAQARTFDIASAELAEIKRYFGA